MIITPGPSDGSDYFLPNRWGALQGPELTAGQDPYADLRDPSAILLPGCHNQDVALLMMDRYIRDDSALCLWAEEAKRCIDFAEGKHWTADELRRADDEDRPLIRLNKIAPLVRLVLGYHRQNRNDITIQPTDDANSTEAIAEILTKVIKQVGISNGKPYVDTEVFLDGILGGRGYFDWRLDFERNDFGEIACSAKDPFTIRPDCDADQYSTKKWGRVTEARWWSLDEIEFIFGKRIANLVSPLVVAGGYRGGIPSDILDIVAEHTPWRTFGGQQGNNLYQGFGSIESYIASSVDPYRKNIRVVDMQHYVRVMQRCVVDLETGDRTPIPEHFKPEDVAKMMQWAALQYAQKQQAMPLRVQWRPVKRVRWTTMVGDIVVYNNWSPYSSFTVVPYFPYWRRGKTKGMVDDLIDPQREVNKRRSSQIDILTRVAHSGWTWHKDSLDEEEKLKIERYGGAAGLNLEYKGSAGPPERIQPGQMPVGIERLEQAATLDLKEIAGINDSALGQVDRVQSGRAIEARQRQSVLGLELYMDNMKRTELLNGEKEIELVQEQYTEPRIFKIQGDGGKWNQVGINARAATGEIVNNVSIGRYGYAITTTPLSDTFMSAQFEELMTLIKDGVIPLAMAQDIAIDLSTVPQKALLKARIDAMLQAQGFVTADQMMMMQAMGMPIPAGMIPPSPEPGKSGGAPGKGNPAKEGDSVGSTAAAVLPPSPAPSQPAASGVG